MDDIGLFSLDDESSYSQGQSSQQISDSSSLSETVTSNELSSVIPSLSTNTVPPNDHASRSSEDNVDDASNGEDINSKTEVVLDSLNNSREHKELRNPDDIVGSSEETHEAIPDVPISHRFTNSSIFENSLLNEAETSKNKKTFFLDEPCERNEKVVTDDQNLNLGHFETKTQPKVQETSITNLQHTLTNTRKIFFDPVRTDSNDSIWWIDFLEKEGLFDIDTTNGPLDKQLVHADAVSAKSSLFPSETLSAKSEHIKKNEIETSPTVTDGAAATEEADSDDDSVLSLVAEEDVITDDDWQERLWIVARQHWEKDESIEEKEENPVTSLGFASIPTPLDHDEHYRGQILRFRNQLKTCLEAYIEVFHDKPSSMTPPGNEEEPSAGSGLSSNGTNTADEEVVSSEGGEEENIFESSPHDTPSIEYEGWPPPAIRVSPYVPVPVVKMLFQEVIHCMDSQSGADEAAGYAGETNMSQHDPVVERVMRAFLSPDFGIFRTYSIQPLPAVNDEDNRSLGSTTPTTKKRIRKERKQTKTNRQDIDDFLYGDMYTHEEKKSDGKDGDATEEADDTEQMQTVNENSETQLELEEELRLRGGVIAFMQKRNQLNKYENMEFKWAALFSKKVLLHDLILERKKSAYNAKKSVEESLAAIEFSSEEENDTLAFMYAIRYLPHFLLRTVRQLNFLSAFGSSPFQMTLKYFCDVGFIRDRLLILGIYNGVMVHMEEMDAFFDALRGSKTKSNEWEDFYCNVHRSLIECLEALMMENMGRAGFFVRGKLSSSQSVASAVDNAHSVATSTKASEAGTTANWRQSKELGQTRSDFDLETGHPQIVSSCLEIGRSLHFLGVSLGKREQERLNALCSEDTRTPVDYNEEMTDLEISSYRLARSSYQGALKTLKNAEVLILSGKQKRKKQDTHVGTMDAAQIANERKRLLEHIREARVTIELYQGDTLTTFAYCQEAKLHDYSRALQAYRDSLSLYARHVGKNHDTVIHTLRSMGCIHIELQEWHEALRSFNECLMLLRRRGMTTSDASREYHEELATVLKSLGEVFVELSDYDTALERFEEALENMKLSLQTDVAIEGNSMRDKHENTPTKAFVHPFICEVMSKLANIAILQASKMKLEYYKNRLAVVYAGKSDFDEDEIDTSQVKQLQLERQAIEWLKESVTIRRQLREQLDIGTRNSGIADDSVDFAIDLSSLGKLHFCRCEYSFALSNWTEAGTILETFLDKSGDTTDNSHHPMSLKRSQKTSEMKLRASDYLIEMVYLLGKVYSRLNQNEKSFRYFGEALGKLKQNFKGNMSSQASGESNKIDLDRQHFLNKSLQIGGAVLGSSGITVELDIGHCEYSIGSTYFKTNQFEKAISHFQEALRLYNSTSTSLRAIVDLRESHSGTAPTVTLKEDLLGVSIEFSVAKVKQSLGLAYSELNQSEEAIQSLSASLEEIEILSGKLAVTDTGIYASIVTRCSSNYISLVTSIVLSGDAHRRVANISKDRGLHKDAMRSMESAIQLLETENTGGRMTVEADDEFEFERVEREEVDDMLMNCYDQMLVMINSAEGDKANDESSVDTTEIETFTREDVLFRMANIYAKKALHGPALECYLQAKALMEEKLETSDHKIMGHLQYNLGNIYKDVSRASHGREKELSREKAIQCFDESLRISRLNDYDASSTADILESLGTLHMAHSDFTRPPSQGDIQAIVFFRDSITIRQKISATMTLTCAQSMHSLGVLLVRKYNDFDDNTFDYRFESEIDEAIEVLTQSVRVRKTILGDHPAVANTMHCLGNAFHLQSKLPQVRGSPVLKNALQHALEVLDDAFYIRKRFLGPLFEGNDTIIAANFIGADGMGAYSASVATIQNLYDMGLIHSTGGNYGDAMIFFTQAVAYLNKFTERCLDMSKKQTEMEEVQTAIEQGASLRANIFFQIACIHEKNGRQEEAIQAFEDSLNSRGFNPMKNSSTDTVFHDFLDGQNVSIDLGDNQILLQMFITMKKVAPAYASIGNLNKTLQCYGVCLRLCVTLYGERSSQMSKILGDAGNVYFQERRYDMCVCLMQEAFNLYELNADDSEVSEEEAIMHMRLGQAIVSSDGENKEALHNFNTAVSAIEKLTEKANTDHLSTNKTPATSRERLLLQCYGSILTLMQGETSGSEEDNEEIAEVMHHIGNLQASLQLYDEAINSFSKVLEIQRMQKGDDHLSIADLLFNLGNIFLETDNLEKARECHEECHRITLIALGESGIELAENMICIGHVEFRCGDYPQALEWYDGAIRLIKNSTGGFEVSMVKVLQRKGLAHDKLGEHDKAIESFGEVLKLGRQIWDRDDLELSNVLNALGNAHRNRLEFARALRCYEESLRIRRKAGEELSVANTKNNIGAVLIALEQSDKAKAFYADALRIKTQQLGNDNTETARTLFNLGQLYVEEKNGDVGLKLLQEALRIFRTNLGSDHYEVGACLHNIAVIHDGNSEDGDALEYFRDAVKIFRLSGNSDSIMASSLYHIGVILFKRNNHEEAKPFFSEALELKLESKDQDEFADTQYYFATLLFESGDIEQSLELHRHALDGRRRQLVHDHADLADSLYAVSQLLISKNLYDDAFDYNQECYDMRMRLFGPEKNETIDAALSLSKVYQEMGRLEECSNLLSQILEVKVQIEGIDSLSVAEVAFRSGIVLCRMGKFADALDMYDESQRIRLLKLGPKHEDISRSKENIGIVHQELGNHSKALDFFREALEAKPSTGDEHEERINTIQHAMAKSYATLGDFEASSSLFKGVLTRLQATYGSENIEVAKVLLAYADVLDQRGELERSLQCYDRVLAIEVLDPNTWEVGNIYTKMGSAYLATEEPSDAFFSFKEAAKIFEGCLSESKYPQNNQEEEAMVRALIQCYSKLLQTAELYPIEVNINKSRYYSKIAHSLVHLKEYEKATGIYRAAIDIQRQTNASEPFIIASNLHNLGNCLYQIGDLNEALPCLQEALLHFRHAPDVEDIIVADTYHCLGLVHHARSDFREALAFFDKALQSRRKSKESDIFTLVSTLYNMGLTLHSLGMYEAALKSCGEALRLSKTPIVNQTLLSSNILACIASSHKEKGELEKSLKCWKECLRKRELVLGDISPLVGNTFYELGLVYAARMEFVSAKACFAKSLSNLETIAQIDRNVALFNGDESGVLDILQVGLDSSHQRRTGIDENPIKIAETILIYSTVLGHHERFPEAIKYCEDALGLLREKLSPDHTIVAEAYYRLGFLHFQVSRFEESLGYVLQALQLRTSKLGEMHPDVENTARLLGQVYGALGHSDDALHYFNQALKWRRARKSKRNQSSDEIEMLIGMGKLHLEELELEEALVCFTESIKLYKQSHNDADLVRLAEILHLLGSALFEKREYDDAYSRLMSAKQIMSEQNDEEQERLLWKIEFSLGQLFEERKSYEEARDSYKDCLKIIHPLKETHQCSVAQTLLSVGRICIATKSFSEGLSLIEEAKTCFVEALGPCHLEVANCWYSLGLLHRSMKNHSNAKDCFNKSLKIGREHLDKNSTALYEFLQSLGGCLSDLQEYIDARNCLEEALQIGIANEGRDCINVGETHRCLAHVQLQIGDLSASLEHFEQSIEIGMSHLVSFEQSNVESEQYSKLNACFEAAIPLAKPENDPERLGRLYHKQGTLQTMSRRHKKALKSYTEALRLYKDFYGDGHVSTANALFNIGVCLNETGDPDRAVKCLSQALHITQIQLGDDHIDIADTLQQLAVSYKLKSDFEKSLEYCNQAMRRRKNKEDAAFAGLLDLDGQLNVECKKSDEAERCFRESVRVKRTLHGDTNLSVADSLFSLGYVYEKFQRDFPKALRCYEECLYIRKSNVGDAGVEVANTYLHLGCVHASQDNENKAIFCFEKVIMIYSSEDNEVEEVVDAAFVNKGQVLFSQGKYEEALECYQKTLDLRRKWTSEEEDDISEENADVFRLKALVFEKLGEEEETLWALNTALAMYKATLGDDHLSTATTLQLLADHFLGKNDHDNVFSLASKALEIRKKALGDSHEDTGDSYFAVGMVHFARNEFEQAQPFFEASLSSFIESRGELHVSVADSLYYIACIHELNKNTEQAIQCFQGSLSGRQYNLGNEHELVADVFFKLGMMHQVQESLDLAAGCFRECLKIRMKVLPEDHIDIGDTHFYFAGVLFDDDNLSSNEEATQHYIDAIRVYNKHLGENHVSVAKCLASLGNIFEDSSDLVKAGSCYQRAITIFDSNLDDDPSGEDVSNLTLEDDYQALAGALLDWATYLDRSGQDSAAMKAYHRAMKLYRVLLGPNHEIMATILCNIANLLGRQERYDEAMSLFDKALKMRVASFGEDHPSVADLLLNCGLIHNKNREYEEAIATIEESLHIRRSRGLEAGVAEALTQLGIVQGNSGDFGGALESWDESLSVYKQLGLPDEDPRVAELVKHQILAKQMINNTEQIFKIL